MAKKTLIAAANYPFLGSHFTEGETRTVEVPKGVEIPWWLTEAKAKKATKKADEGEPEKPKEG